MLTQLKAFAASLLIAGSLAVAPAAFAQVTGTTGAVGATADLQQNKNCTDWQIANGFCQTSVRETVRKVLNFALIFLSLVVTGFLIYGGYLYVTAGANEDNTGKAKNIITYSAIGIVMIFFSFAIVNTLITGLNAAGTNQ